MRKEAIMNEISICIKTWADIDGSGRIVGIKAKSIQTTASATTVVRLRLDELEDRLRATVDGFFRERFGKEASNEQTQEWRT